MIVTISASYMSGLCANLKNPKDKSWPESMSAIRQRGPSRQLQFSQVHPMVAFVNIAHQHGISSEMTPIPGNVSHGVCSGRARRTWHGFQEATSWAGRLTGRSKWQLPLHTGRWSKEHGHGLQNDSTIPQIVPLDTILQKYWNTSLEIYKVLKKYVLFVWGMFCLFWNIRSSVGNM